MNDINFLREEELDYSAVLDEKIALFRLIFWIMLAACIMFGIFMVWGSLRQQEFTPKKIAILSMLGASLIFIGWGAYYAFNVWQGLKKDKLEKRVFLYKNSLKRHFIHRNQRYTVEFEQDAVYSIRSYISEKRYKELKEGDEVIVVIGKESKEVLDVYKHEEK